MEIALFLTCFAAFSYFHQGGGWNQTARFNQVRAIVETGKLNINAFMCYQVFTGEDGRSEIVRQPIPDPMTTRRNFRLNTGDYSQYGGRYYPNKPPGTTFLAVPAYHLVNIIERIARISPDTVWNLNINAYLTTIFSVGIFSAFGVVLFLRLSQLLFPDLPAWSHVAAALSFAFGTLVLPFSTLLFDHVPVAVLLMTAFYLLARERLAAAPPTLWRPLLAGLAAGYAVVCNYPAALGVAFLTLYALWVLRPLPRVTWFLLGGLAMAMLLAIYHNTCFGDPLANANTYQNVQFKDKTQKLLFGMISQPDLLICGRLLFGTFRGIFFTAPILLASGLGFWQMFKKRGMAVEAALCLAAFVTFLLFNSSFNGWHGGMTMGPRYLIPAIPFLALPLAIAYAKLWPPVATLAALSAFGMFLGVIVTPLAPENRPNPVWDFLFPIAFGNPKGGDFDRFKGPVSAWPAGFQGVRVTDESWNCFNIGEFVWPQSGLSVVPLLLVVFAGVTASLWLSRSRPIEQ